jgi:hypothetical protein
MRTRGLLFLVLLGAALGAAGCSSSTAGTSSGGGTGGTSGWSGASGSGGASGMGGATIVVTLDAGMGAADAAAGADAGAQSPNLSTDGPTFNWDTRTCTSCTGVGGAGGSTAASAGGSPGSGGSGGASGTSAGSGGRITIGGMTGSAGGMVGVGGMASVGGAVGRGGSTGGGSTGTRADGGVNPQDGSSVTDTLPSADVAPNRDTVTTADASTDLPNPDLGNRCDARIRALVPSTADLESFPLVAGANTQVMLRAEILSGGPVTTPNWYWQATRDGLTVNPTARGATDPASIAFPVASEGTYTFIATDGASPCSAKLTVTAVASNACPACDRSVILRAAPPPSGNIPVQSGAIGLAGSSPFAGTNVVLASGVPVYVSPSVGSNLVPAYVRISSPAGDLVADGLADPRARFGALLLAMDNNLALLHYDVLVVPINGTSSTTVAATAPQLFQNQTPDQINANSFSLTGGVSVNGSTLAQSATGPTPISNTRVILTNRDPKATTQTSDLIFSSVGQTDASGNFALFVQAGSYWVSLSPPPGSGLAEALAPAPVGIQGNATIAFQWSPITLASLTLRVLDFTGAPMVDGARVRLTSSAATAVGTLDVTGAVTGGAAQTVLGNVRVEGTTAGGSVTFTNLPVNTSYDVLIVPPSLSMYGATTLLTVSLPSGGATASVQTLAQGRIKGKLLSGISGVAPDWTKVNLVAYDRSGDTPESPLIIGANLDATFSIPVSPGRPYVVVAVPDSSTDLARTFVGPGPLEATEFTLTQRVQAAMPWTAMVTDQGNRGVGGAALQVFCGATWPKCVDPSVPLAETTAGSSGAFQLDLPDPSTR